VFADLEGRRVLFATEGKDHWMFEESARELGRHNGHQHASSRIAMDMNGR